MTVDDDILEAPGQGLYQYEIAHPNWDGTETQIEIVVASQMMFFPGRVLGFLGPDGRLVKAFNAGDWSTVAGIGHIPGTSGVTN